MIEPMTDGEALAIIRGIVEQRQAEPEPFTDLVRRMRRAQVGYSQNRTQENLIEARRLEKQVDAYLRNAAMEPQP